MLELKTAMRTLIRRPGFSLWIIAIFAGGIAANTTVFSIFEGLFLRTLPFPRAERLISIQESVQRRNMQDIGVSPADLESWRTGTGAFEDIAGLKEGDGAYLSGAGETIRVKIVSVTYNMAATLGIKPIFGRDFVAEEDHQGRGHVVLLKYDFWRKQFAGRADVVGRVARLDNEPFTIVGVLPKTAVYPGDSDLWMPLGPYFPGDGARFLGCVGRLKPEFTLAQGRADLLRIHQSLIPSRPANQFTEPEIKPLRDHYLGNYRPLILATLGAVMFVLLIACVNVAGLTLARGTARSREFAIREALGAGRRRVIGQLLSESMLLAAAGGVLGVLLSWTILRIALSMMPDMLPSWVDITLDFRVVLFALLATGAAGALAGFVPALHASKMALRETLADAASTASLSRGRRRAMNMLVIGEIAVAMVLLVAGGLVVKAFHRVLNTEPGFRPQSVLTFAIDLPLFPMEPERVTHFYDALLARLRLVPGVDSAGAVGLYGLPFSTIETNSVFISEEVAKDSRPDQPSARSLQRFVTPGYLETMGITLKAGREFEEHDGYGGGATAVIVDELFASRVWPGEPNVVGKRVTRAGRNTKWMTVAGVAQNVRNDGLDRDLRPTVYVPYQGQEYAFPQMAVVVHGAASAESQLSAAREIVREMDPSVVLFDVHTMQERVGRSLWVRRAYSWLFGIFAGFGLVLALAGIYGVISYTVAQRTREIGIRMALGANSRQVLVQVLREGMVLAGIGVAAGLGAAGYGTRLLESMLDGVNKNDPWVLAIVSVLLAGAALAANALPARRAASVNPVDALRSER